MKRNLVIFHLLFSVVLYSQSSTPINNNWQTNGPIYSIVVDSSYTYIGGFFNYIGPYTGAGAKILTTSTTPDTLFSKVQGSISLVISDGDGGWYIAGEFNKVGNETRNYVARINKDGSLNKWNPNPDNMITSMAISGDNIYLGGWFSKIDGQPRKFFVKLNSEGIIDQDWNPNPNGVVLSIATFGQKIFAGGEFTNIGGKPRNYLAKLNDTDGGADEIWNPNPNNTISKIVLNDSSVFVSGNFTKMGGLIRHYIAKLNHFDGNASNWDPGLRSGTKLIVIDHDNLYMCANFLAVPEGRTYWAIVNTNDGTKNIFDRVYGYVNTIAINGDDLYIGGDFSNIGGGSGNTSIYLAKLNVKQGKVVQYYTFNKTVNAIAISDSNIYIGGDFTSSGGAYINNLCRITNESGKVDVQWQPNPNGLVKTLALSSNHIFVGGNFSSIGGYQRYFLAKINKLSSTADPIWNPAPNYMVNALAIQDSFVYVGGSFINIYEEARGYLARVKIGDGSLDFNWNPDVYYINCLLINEKAIYAGGGDGLYKLNLTDGKTDKKWLTNSNGFINTLSTYGGEIFVGGKFTVLGTTTINNLAKINESTSTVDRFWNPNPKNEVKTMINEKDNLFVGGSFSPIFEEKNTCLLSKVNCNNNQFDVAWNPNPNNGPSPYAAYPEVLAITSYKNKLYIGGNFTYMGNVFTNSFVVFDQSGVVPVELTSFSSTISNTVVSLNWATATETNNNGFEVQRKSDYTHWETIAFIKGIGTTTNFNFYHYSDSSGMNIKSPSGRIYYRLKQMDLDGTYTYSKILDVKLEIPNHYSLSQNFPNPFNPNTTIKFEIPNTENVILKIYNILGCEVKTLINETKPAGTYELNFNAFDLASGVYFYRLEAGVFSDTKKLVILR